MLFLINDLTGYTANAEDFTASIIDAFVARDTMRISHLAIDIGGWLSNHTVVISTEKILDINPDGRTITLQITKEQAERADVLDTTTLEDGLQLSDIPELILGPSSADVARAFLSKNAPDGQFISVVEAAGTVACHGNDELGQVIALIAQSDDMTVSHLAIDTGVVVPETQRVVPMSVVQSIGTKKTKTELKINGEKLQGSPQLEEFDAIDRHWLDKVASYYGLS